MALSDDKLWDLWNAQGTDNMSKEEAFVFARAIEAEVRKDDEALIRQMEGALSWSSPHADAAHGWKSENWARKRSEAITAARARLLDSDLSNLTERGAKAWTGVDAQALREGGASAGSEPVAGAVLDDEGAVCLIRRGTEREYIARRGGSLLYTHPSPPEGMVGGWISVDKRLPEPNVEVLCAGQGWGKPFVTACYYDDGRREWYPINTYWTDSTGSAQYPTHWMPLPPRPTSSADSRKGE